MTLPAGLRGAVEQELGTIATVHPGAASSFASTNRVELANGQAVFLKWCRNPPPGFFEAEAAGLAALGANAILRTPQVISVGAHANLGWIALQLIADRPPAGPHGASAWRRLGRGLAELHLATASERCGFACPTFLGATRQTNSWENDPVVFLRRRLAELLELAEARRVANPELYRAMDRLEKRLDEHLGGVRRPFALLHGDLWRGNVLFADGAEPVLIDPAAWYGPVEAELAMTRLFGGFGVDFETAYREVVALDRDADRRIELLTLPHLLNHLVLFGRGYLEATIAVAERFG